MLTEFTAKADILNKIIRSCIELNFNLMLELQKQFRYCTYSISKDHAFVHS